MWEIWIEAKRRLKTGGAFLIAAGAALGLAIWYVFSRRARSGQATERIDSVIDLVEERIAAANARAAIEIHVARAKEETVVAELRAIDADPDGERRRQA